MRVSHLYLKNWRNFLHVDVKLSERMFFVGPNASGKSNLLDAFKFLRDICKPGGGLQKAVEERGGISRIRCLSARKYPDVEIGIVLSNGETDASVWKYEIGIKQEVRGYRQPYLAYERVWKGGKALLTRPNAADKLDPLLLTQTYLEQISANVEFRDVSRFLESISYMHLVPQLVRYQQAFSGTGIPGDPFGKDFLDQLAKTQSKVRTSRLKKIEQALRIAVPQLKELTFVQDMSGHPHLEAIHEHWRPMGAKQREDQFSDGTLRLVGLLWTILDSDSLLLIEEPELSLNAGIVNRLAGLFYRLQRQKGRQVLISTHSVDLLTDRGIGTEEVLVLRPSHEGTEVKNASSISEIKDLIEKGMSVGEAALPYTYPINIAQLDLFR
jgi:predicted ATPase